MRKKYVVPDLRVYKMEVEAMIGVDSFDSPVHGFEKGGEVSKEAEDEFDSEEVVIH